MSKIDDLTIRLCFRIEDANAQLKEMFNNNDDNDDKIECPLCENPAHATAEIDMGDNWKDIAGRPPFSFFGEYQMVHVAEQTMDGTLKVFLHKVQ